MIGTPRNTARTLCSNNRWLTESVCKPKYRTQTGLEKSLSLDIQSPSLFSLLYLSLSIILNLILTQCFDTHHRSYFSLYKQGESTPDLYYLVAVESTDVESTLVATESTFTAVESAAFASAVLLLPVQAVKEAITTIARTNFLIFCFCFKLILGFGSLF